MHFNSMIVIFIVALTQFNSQTVWAATSSKFFGMQGMINISSKDARGPLDDDAQTLFAEMNVPVQDSFMGPGKSIVADNKALNFVCSNSNTRGYMCTIMLSRSSHTQLSSSKMVYSVDGVLAQEISAKFHKVNYKFISTDGIFSIHSTPEKFELIYNESGVN